MLSGEDYLTRDVGGPEGDPRDGDARTGASA